jgi:hypothetical protein
MAAFPVKALREASDWESRLPGGGIPSQGGDRAPARQLYQNRGMSILVITKNEKARFW